MGNWDWKWAFVFMLLVGVYLYYDASNKGGMTKTLEQRGILTKGMIIDGRQVTHRKGSSDFYVKVQYTPGDRGTKKQELQVTSDYYRRIAQNMPVEVLYLEEDPLQFMIKDVPLYSETNTTVALIVLLLGLAGSAWLGFDYWKAKNSTA